MRRGVDDRDAVVTAPPVFTVVPGRRPRRCLVRVAVLVVLLGSVDHAFWVALGTLSVLRSNALSTGRSALEAAAGTAVGFAVAAAVLAVLGVDRIGLWVVMVLGFFCAAYFPQVLGFIAGQAAFTVLVVALFNLIIPEGWRTGLVRIEDIAIGATVSVVVALVFWPRRAEVSLRRIVAILYRALAVAATAPDLEHRRAVRGARAGPRPRTRSTWRRRRRTPSDVVRGVSC